jgi:hypothetical protein
VQTGTLSLWALCEGNLKGVSFTEDPEDYTHIKEGSGDGHLSIGASLGNLEWGSFPGDFERWMIRVSLSVGAPLRELGMGSVYRVFEDSLKEGSGYGASPSMGAVLKEPGGEAPWLGTRNVMKGRLWGRASVFMAAQLGKMEWAHLPGTLRYSSKALWGRSVSLCGSSVKGTWREGSLSGDPEG